MNLTPETDQKDLSPTLSNIPWLYVWKRIKNLIAKSECGWLVYCAILPSSESPGINRRLKIDGIIDSTTSPDSGTPVTEGSTLKEETWPQNHRNIAVFRQESYSTEIRERNPSNRSQSFSPSITRTLVEDLWTLLTLWWTCLKVQLNILYENLEAESVIWSHLQSLFFTETGKKKESLGLQASGQIRTVLAPVFGAFTTLGNELNVSWVWSHLTLIQTIQRTFYYPDFLWLFCFLAYCETKSHVAHAATSSLSVIEFRASPHLPSAGDVGVHPHDHTLAS